MSAIKNSIFLILIFHFLWSMSAYAQDIPKYLFENDIVVERDGIKLRNAWAGGLNFVQIEAFDFNNDGLEDLLVFDRSGNKIMPFICKTENNEIKYIFKDKYSKSFPKVVNWIKLIDYNCDGQKDIFAYNRLGIEVWKNISKGDSIEFEQLLFEYNIISGTKYLPAIKTNTGGEYDTNLNIIFQDIPAIVDIDNNGSIDILNFGLGSAIPEGSTVEFHKNSNPCGLEFTRETVCWGGFAENYTNNSVSLEVCKKPSIPKTKEIQMHAGSSLLVSDFSGNGLPDMLIGDITFENATLVYNTGDIDNAWMTEKDDNFPNYSTPISLEYFPGFSLIDIDKDGTLDLIASPAIKGSMNNNSIWRYKNISESNIPNYELNNKSFLQDEMIDVGEASNPHLYDIDNDGLIDLLIGNFGYYQEGGSYKSGISYYKNTGNKSLAKFDFVSDNYGNFSQYPWVDIYPTFGDLNNDGIADIILGYEDDKTNGFIHYFEGTGNGNYTFKYPQYLDVDVGNSARPKLVDIDEDGLLDLIIGNKKGNLHFFKNEGTKEEANFQLVSKKWGDIDLSNIDVQGAWLSSDILDHSKYGKLLLLGTITGVTYAYKNISTNPESVFELFSYNFFGSNEGEKATISVGDINNDKYPDIVIGNMSGGLRLALDSSEIIAHENKLVVYPNPIEENNYLFLKYKTNLSKLKLEAFDISGRRVNIIILDDRIDISKLNNGIYILREYLKGEYISAKFIISR